jgi:S-formylglutathione hydrolase FrmB
MLSRLFKKISLAGLGILFCCLRANAAKVDTVVTHSDAMNKDVKAVVITPDDYNKREKYPVLYLLHGYSGCYSDWIKKVPAVASLADQYHCIIVCPDGNFASWYFDSPLIKDFKYETYITSELLTWIDQHYSTIANRTGRAVTGLSMGGHGALYLAIRHQDLYGAAGSMSGCVDLIPFAKFFGIGKVLGDYKDSPERWRENSVINMLGQIKAGSLAIILDCGYNDGFYPSNMEMHNRMVKMNIPHDFIVRQGGHNWQYWSNSIVYQMLFFSRFFNKEK